jgi:succinoglycan biosynthesis protein ExoM
MLASLREMGDPGIRWRVLIVDNPPTLATQEAVETASAKINVEYVAEAVGSITGARNRALEEAIKAGAEALVFIDDDELVASDWLKQLWAAHLQGRKDVVFGHVETVLPPGTPDEIVRSGIAQRPIYADGSLHHACASNNTLIPVDALGEIWFDSRFDRSSGEDTDFFRRLKRSGVGIRYCSAARVSEPWTHDRANTAFLMERARRIGWLDAMVCEPFRG